MGSGEVAWGGWSHPSDGVCIGANTRKGWSAHGLGRIMRKCGSGGEGCVDIGGGVALSWLGGSSCEFTQGGAKVKGRWVEEGDR